MSTEGTETTSEPSDTSPEAEGEEAPEQDGQEAEGEQAEAPAKQPRDKSYMGLRRKAEKLRRERETVAAERSAVEREKMSIAEERQLAQQWRRLSELSKTDRLAAARELGLDYDAMTKEMLEDASLSDAEKATRRELAELKRDKERREREDQEREAIAQAQARRAKSTEELTAIAADKAAYPFASSLDPKSLIRKADALVDEMRERKIPLDDVTFEDLVYAIEKRQAQKADKWRKILGLTPAQAAAKVASDDRAAAPAGRHTLSSKDSGDASKKPERPRTREERRAAAIAKIPD